MDRADLIARLRMEIGPFTAFVAGNPLKFVIALLVIGFVAGALLV